jgi:hypothetical protein
MATRIRNKLLSALSLAVVLALLLAPLAFADNTIPDGDGMEPVASHPMDFGTVCAGSTTMQTALIRVNRNGNAGSPNVFKDGSTVTVSVLSVSGAGLSAVMSSPNTITLPSNWGSLANNSDSDYVSSDVTFVAGAAGSFSGSVRYRGSGVNSSNTTIDRDASMTVTATIVDCAPNDITPPDISYVLDPASPDGDNSWYKSDVTLTWTVTEDESPDSLVKTGCEDQSLTSDQAETAYSCSATSDGGSAGPVTVSIKRDATPPTISGSRSTDANAYGWNNADVVVSFLCEDNLSGVASCGPDQTLGFEGAGQSVTGTAVDDAGNSASTIVDGINIDKTAPTISAGATTDPNSAGWYNHDVTVHFTCADRLAGIPDGACPTDQALSDEGAAVASAAQTVKDKAGNTSDPSNVVTVSIDKTAPGITWNGGFHDGDIYYFGFVPPEPSCTASDALSGPNGCTVEGYATTLGAHTLTATAKDVAGNQTVDDQSYKVLAWTLNGFYQPVDMPTPTKLVYNSVKNGSTVPLKFEIFAGPTELADVSYVKSLTYAQTACDASATTDEIETTATGGTSLRYDTTAGQFVYNWKTPSTAGRCYRVTMTTLDGTSLVAYFKLR